MPIKDIDLLQLGGLEVRAGDGTGEAYVLRRVIGEGAHGVVFFAETNRNGVASPVAIKLLRPRAVRDLAGLAAAALVKEVAALKRLSERAIPHVVQFFDAGALRIGENQLELPWLAVEYVDGGREGVTLRERVQASLASTGYAFEPDRARRALRCICEGAAAMHELGVIHRDIAPGNVLCSGTGADERFKLADFGLARVSSAATFGNILLGTPGYCAPEQSFPDELGIGSYSDVFAIACTAFFLLAGAPYFAAPSIPETLVAVYANERRRLADAPNLHPKLRSDPEACAVIDELLARATRPSPRERPQTATEFAVQMLLVMSPP